MSEYVFRDSVFILGAGSSCPYGFPSGNQLKQVIIDLINNHPDNDWSSTQINTEHFLRNLKAEGYGYHEVKELGEKLQISGASSIDSFLQDSHDIDPKLVKLAKMVIYYLISQDEVERNLRWNDWIEPFVHYSMERHRDEFLLSPPKVLSFNYDNLFRKKVESIMRIQYQVQDYAYPNIEHVYGRTLGLNFDRDHKMVVKVDYFDEIKQESEFISLVRKPGEGTLKDFRTIINGSNKVIILGYGFDSKNNNLLFDTEKDSLGSHIKNMGFYATGYGADESILKGISDRSPREAYIPIKKDEKCEDLIKRLIPKSFF